MLALIIGLAVALAGFAHVCRRIELRQQARMVSMRWDEISARGRSRTAAARGLIAGRRLMGRARDPLLLMALCVAVASVALLPHG
jgi:hypothetical protein